MKLKDGGLSFFKAVVWPCPEITSTAKKGRTVNLYKRTIGVEVLELMLTQNTDGSLQKLVVNTHNFQTECKIFSWLINMFCCCCCFPKCFKCFHKVRQKKAFKYFEFFQIKHLKLQSSRNVMDSIFSHIIVITGNIFPHHWLLNSRDCLYSSRLSVNCFNKSSSCVSSFMIFINSNTSLRLLGMWESSVSLYLNSFLIFSSLKGLIYINKRIKQIHPQRLQIQGILGWSQIKEYHRKPSQTCWKIIILNAFHCSFDIGLVCLEPFGQEWMNEQIKMRAFYVQWWHQWPQL